MSVLDRVSRGRLLSEADVWCLVSGSQDLRHSVDHRVYLWVNVDPRLFPRQLRPRRDPNLDGAFFSFAPGMKRRPLESWPAVGPLS